MTLTALASQSPCGNMTVMATVTFDTHKAVKALQDAGADERLAEAFVATVSESREADSANLATKADLAALEARMVKWLVPLLLGQAALIVALLKLLP